MNWNLVLLCSVSAFWAVETAALNLVADGKPAGEFVIPSDAPYTEVYAVRDIRHWIKEMTGAKIPIVSEPSRADNTKVMVGKASAAAFQKDLDALAGTDGFAIRRRDNKVHVFGDRPLGTLHGLYALLEKNSDIIWARPNERFGAVHGRYRDLELSDTDCLDKPVFGWRSFALNHPPQRSDAIWQLRNRLNSIGRGLCDGPEWDTNLSKGTNMFNVIKMKYGMKHPEWYGYKPMTNSRDCGAGEGSLCMSIPELPRLWAEAAAEWVEATERASGRPVKAFFVGTGDNWFCCQCEKCLQPITLPDGSSLKPESPDAIKDMRFRSTQWYMFLNEAMKTWRELLPRTKLVSLAYLSPVVPPAVEVDPDLLVYLAPYPTNSMHLPLLDSRQPKFWRETFEGWLGKTRNLGFYEYFYSKPTPQGFYAAANLRALLKNGNPDNAILYTEIQADRGQGSLGDGARGWDIGGMSAWVVTRLFWNPNQDVDQLYQHYLRRAYREATPQMTKFYEIVRGIWLDPDNQSLDACHTSSAYVYDETIVKHGKERECLKLLADAEKATENQNSKTLIRRMLAVINSYHLKQAVLRVANVPEMSHDGDSFDSIQWEKPEALDDFKIVRRIGEYQTPPLRTELKAASDGKHLYLRVTAHDAAADKIEAAPRVEAVESWPKGDHVEIWLETSCRFVFALASNGNTYDAKNLDRYWNSGWRVVTRKTNEGWEAIAVIPLEALGVKAGQESTLKWFCVRSVNHVGAPPVTVSYQGQPLFRKNFPLVFE